MTYATTLTDYLCNKLLDHAFGKTVYTAPTTLYIGFGTGCTRTGTVSGEPTGNNYSRITVTNNTTNFSNAATASKANGAVIDSAVASGTWSGLTTIFISDDPTAGNILAYGTISPTGDVTANVNIHIAIAGLTIAFA